MAIVAGHSDVDMGTIITIQPHRSWIGSVMMAGRTTTSGVSPYVEVANGGVGVNPVAGTKVITCILAKDASDNVSMPQVYVEAGDAAAILRLRFNGAVACTGIANGYDGGVGP